MNWTERDIAIAKQLVEPATLAFIRKIFCDIKTNNGEVIEDSKVTELDDAEYGRLMKVVVLSRKENKAKINLIQKIAKSKKEEKTTKPLAPK